MPAEDPTKLRSARWFEPHTYRASGHRQRLQQGGFAREQFMGRPVVAVVNTWSDLSPCHAHLRERAESVKRGVLQAGGFPVELPALSLSEAIVKPTTMIYRNMLALEVEELLRSHPVDGAVLLGGCDKTTPGLLMGALSMNIPAIFQPAGPMLNGNWRGQKIGAGTHGKRFWNDLKAGGISHQDWLQIEPRNARSTGTCNTMGTASTMTSIVEAMGMSLPGAATTPGPDAENNRNAYLAGHRAVDMIWEDLKPRDVICAESLRNGLIVYAALGGSTNAAVHSIAIARRAGLKLTLDELGEIARDMPVLVNLMPSGNFLMEDFHFAGGVPGLMNRISDRLDLGCVTVTGKSVGENIADAEIHDNDVVRTLDNPVSERRALAVLRGNLCPDGAVIKPSAASPELLKHTGKAVVFENAQDMADRVDDPNLEVDKDSVLVLKNAGPVGAPGMPEWGNLAIPQKLLRQGVRDMVRISDGRMSGTHAGACVLHVAPESYIGGPLALVQSGDEIALDVEARSLQLLVPDEELARRRAQWKPPAQRRASRYGALFASHVTQANEGCDFDVPGASEPVPEPEIQ